MVNMTRMEDQLILHEGIEFKPYKDTKGIWTIAIGYNFQHRGWSFLEKAIGRKVSHLPLDQIVLTEAECRTVLRGDIIRVQGVVSKLLPKFESLNEVRQRVCVDMAFNMGMKALNFKKAIDAINKELWSKASRELYSSKWSTDVGDGKTVEQGGRFGREDRLANMLLTGIDYVR